MTVAAAPPICLLSLALIGALPRVFFRRGRLNAQWWLTAGPFIAAALILTAAMAGLIQPVPLPAGAAALLGWAAVPLAGAAITLVGYTIGSHVEPVSLWHQAADTPERLVTRGAYARVRHPFYASFLLTLTACVSAFPHPLTLLALAWATVQLNRTAAREERRLLSAFGAEYADYVRRTNRFLPRAARPR